VMLGNVLVFRKVRPRPSIKEPVLNKIG